MIELKIGDTVHCKQKQYEIFMGISPTSPCIKMTPETDVKRIAKIKGFQDPETNDGRDVILRWNDFLWDTTMPSEFLILKKSL